MYEVSKRIVNAKKVVFTKTIANRMEQHYTCKRRLDIRNQQIKASKPQRHHQLKF